MAGNLGLDLEFKRTSGHFDQNATHRIMNRFRFLCQENTLMSAKKSVNVTRFTVARLHGNNYNIRINFFFYHIFNCHQRSGQA